MQGEGWRRESNPGRSGRRKTLYSFFAKYFSTFFKKLERKLGGCREFLRMQRKTFQIPQFDEQTKSSVLQSSIYIINIIMSRPVC